MEEIVVPDAMMTGVTKPTVITDEVEAATEFDMTAVID
jgi:hypothetical protein